MWLTRFFHAEFLMAHASSIPCGETRYGPRPDAAQREHATEGYIHNP